MRWIDELVSNLNTFLSDTTGIGLNGAAYAFHTANFRSDVIRQSFERAGFNPLLRIQKDPNYSVVRAELFPDEAQPLHVVDDLARRRNEVAYGRPPQQLLQQEFLQAYSSMIEAFLVGLLDSERHRLAHSSIECRGVELGRPDGIYRQNIAGYLSVAAGVGVGDVVGIRSGTVARVARVQAIEVDRVASQHAPIGSPVGLNLSHDIPACGRIWLLPAWLDVLMN